MIILGIETSCDETAVALVKNGTKVLSSVISSSLELHKKTGGIIPEIAAREQLRFIIPAIEQVFDQAQLKPEQIETIAVTYGPGLIGSLLVGIETAKTLSYLWEKPLIPINHLQAHLYANWLETNQPPKLPAVGLVVSGGHTDIILFKNHGHYEYLGGTRDDAAGECFDKTARTLGLSYPGGPEIARLAETFEKKALQKSLRLPRPMLNQDNLDLSFSGLKTAVVNEVRKLEKIKPEEVAHEIQEAITDVLVEKVKKAWRQTGIKNLLISGGVAANQRLRARFAQLAQKEKVSLHIPPPKFCTDNGAVIASCAFFNHQPLPWQQVQANPNLSICQ